MHRFVILLAFFLLSLACYGQSSCDISKFSTVDSLLLRGFCHELQFAIATKDKQKTEALCHFPFISYHIEEDTTGKNAPYVTVTKALFQKSMFKLFTQQNLIDEVTNNEIFKLLQVDKEKNKCSYSFSYPIIKPSAQWEGLQGFFTIKKIKGDYKITAAWTVP